MSQTHGKPLVRKDKEIGPSVRLYDEEANGIGADVDSRDSLGIGIEATPFGLSFR